MRVLLCPAILLLWLRQGRDVAVGNTLPTVQINGHRGGKIGNQNARKVWRKEGK